MTNDIVTGDLADGTDLILRTERTTERINARVKVGKA